MDNCLTMNPVYCIFRVKDPISALTHFIGFCAAMLGMPLLLIRAAACGADARALASFAIFMLSMIMLYGASTAYHSFHISEGGDKILKKLDHMMIFVLIAGSYTPVSTLVLDYPLGRNLLCFIWAVAATGMIFKAVWVTCPKWVSSVIYITMGWTAAFVIVPIFRTLGLQGFMWLLCGGLFYTVGGVIYAFKFSFSERFGAHELFHIFVMLGSFCHYMMMFLYVAQL